MNAEWSEKNKRMQALIGKEATFREGIGVLLELRKDVFSQIESIAKNYPPEAFYQMPFFGADGYHSKTLAYSMWHVFRIEDITCHELVAKDGQVLFSDGWLERTKSPIVTTGNELKGDEIAAFSRALDVKELLRYGRAVADATDAVLRGLTFADLKKRFTDGDRERLCEGGCVSRSEDAFWLIDYWCGKDVAGLIRMPFSRHWIMHTEAMCRIKNRLCRDARKGVDPAAYCGLSCDHCFLKEWCGSCRTAYNTCSYATCSPGGICPNAACCTEKGLDGCYDCREILSCRKGFYENGSDGNAVKAMALFIKKHGKKELRAVLEELHRKYDFKKIQEILGRDTEADAGLKILEENRRA